MTKNREVQILIKGCLKGNQTSQLRLYEHFYSYGMGISLRFTQSRQEALEVLNDGFLKAFLKIESYDSSFPFKPWLRRILINASIDYYRKYHKADKEESNFLPPENPSTHNLAIENLAFEDLLQVMQKLSPAYRMVFNLYAIEGMTHKDIALQLGISVGASKSNLSKARKHLQSMLGASHGIYHKPKQNG